MECFWGLLFVAISARLPMLLPIAFFCTQVAKSTKQDQTKFKCILENIKEAFDLVYSMRVDSLNKIQSWVDVGLFVKLTM